MITIKGVEYRSLEEQVYKNMIDIANQALSLSDLAVRVTSLEESSEETPANMVTTDTEQVIIAEKTFQGAGIVFRDLDGYDGDIKSDRISLVKEYDGKPYGVRYRVNDDNREIVLTGYDAVQANPITEEFVLTLPKKTGTLATTDDRPANMVTTDTEQVITAEKTFQGAGIVFRDLDGYDGDIKSDRISLVKEYDGKPYGVRYRVNDDNREIVLTGYDAVQANPITEEFVLTLPKKTGTLATTDDASGGSYYMHNIEAELYFSSGYGPVVFHVKIINTSSNVFTSSNFSSAANIAEILLKACSIYIEDGRSQVEKRFIAVTGITEDSTGTIFGSAGLYIFGKGFEDSTPNFNLGINILSSEMPASSCYVDDTVRAL